MVKKAYRDLRSQRKRPWWEVAREEMGKRPQPQQWEQIEKKAEAEIEAETTIIDKGNIDEN